MKLKLLSKFHVASRRVDFSKSLGGPTYNNQNFFGEILRISFALFVRRNSTFDAVFFSVLSRLRNERTVFWKKKEKTKTRGG